MWYRKFFKPKIKNIVDYELPKREACSAEIIISIYNGENNIRECLESLIPKLNSQLRLVILDDNSTDNSLFLIKKIIKNKKNITLIKNDQNLGLSINLFRLVKSSNAIFCIRMDIDDIVVSNRFELQLDYMNKNKSVDILGSQAIYIDDKNEIIGKSNKPTSNKEIKDNLYRNPFIHPSVIFRREKIINIGNYSYFYPHGQDYELWMRAAFFNLRFANLNKPLIKYRKSKTPKYNIRTLFYELIVGLYWLPKIKAYTYQYIIIIGRFLYRTLSFFLFKIKNVFIVRATKNN